ncbi:MAG TPA: DUF2442 domain-containing protein [Candidatus Dormibacteraeota bacterium]|nr:DUF2442 domain-containing protein [Candidatus Dormibacteraeota bacterium]
MATKAPRYGKREHDAAVRRGDALANLSTALTRATLDEGAKIVHLRFRNGIELAIPIKAIHEIANVPIARLRDVTASPMGDGLLFDCADVAIYVPGLLRDLFADAFAGALGKIGGRSRSSAKAAAARKNGLKGGRPRLADSSL